MRVFARLPALLAFLPFGCTLMQTAPPDPALAAAPLPPGEVRPQARPAPPPEAAAPSARGALGTTIVSLGNPAEPGLWLKTPLVSSRQPGRVVLDGRDVAVTLIPLDAAGGAGSRLSLEAFQALGLPLTDLAEVSVNA